MSSGKIIFIAPSYPRSRDAVSNLSSFSRDGDEVVATWEQRNESSLHDRRASWSIWRRRGRGCEKVENE